VVCLLGTSLNVHTQTEIRTIGFKICHLKFFIQLRHCSDNSSSNGYEELEICWIGKNSLRFAQSALLFGPTVAALMAVSCLQVGPTTNPSLCSALESPLVTV